MGCDKRLEDRLFYSLPVMQSEAHSPRLLESLAPFRSGAVAIVGRRIHYRSGKGVNALALCVVVVPKSAHEQVREHGSIR